VTTIDPAAYEGDIVSRLRHWRGLHLAHCGTLFEAAATEIEVQRACTSAARDEIARLRLNDEERKAIGNMIHLIECQHEDYGKEAATLRKLLERLHA
jgi:hypothetical protein